MWSSIGFDWYHNPINATFKSGILYEGWGQSNDKVFHGFPANSMAMHYCPWEMQNAVLKSGLFKVTEGEVDPGILPKHFGVVILQLLMVGHL